MDTAGLHTIRSIGQVLLKIFKKFASLIPTVHCWISDVPKVLCSHDFQNACESKEFKGIDISEYAIANAHPSVQHNLAVGDARVLQFEDDTFDLVVSINTLHNLELDDIVIANEINRVSKTGRSFVVVDAYRNEAEREAMYAWNLTAKTILSCDEWIKFFSDVGYAGDYWWFTP